ncbi:alginate export family protein [Floridanema evergladense]|uniref:Alginate export family protein n=1 Tax=Floridaenema evergladense BLCC-F167 TaxID=3153639 RepID=A0ABV4WH75_9CYAN
MVRCLLWYRYFLGFISISTLSVLGFASVGFAQVTPTVNNNNQVIFTRAIDLLEQQTSAEGEQKITLEELSIFDRLQSTNQVSQQTESSPINSYDPNAGILIPPRVAEGSAIERVYIHLKNPTNDPAKNQQLQQQITETFAIRAGSSFSPLFAQKATNQVQQLAFIESAEYRVYQADNPGGVIVALLVTLQPEETSKPPQAKEPRGIFVTGRFGDFPTLYESDRTLVKLILNAGFGVFSDTNPWFGNSQNFVRGNYQPKGTITWPEFYIEPGFAGITKIGNIPLYVYGAFSFTQSATLAPDIFRDDTRFYGAVEKLYGGFLFTEKGSPISFNISAGRQNFQLNRNFLFGQVLGSANALERGASFLNARTVYDNAVLADLRIGQFLIQGFYLNPNELPIADTESRFLGVNLKYNNNRNLEAALAYITVPQSNTVYAFPDGKQQTREGLQVINPRVRWTSPFGIEGLWVESEYAHEWNSNFAMSAHAGYIWGGYTFQNTPWRPSISYRFAAFSGDNPKTSTYERFDSLRGGGLGDWLQGINLAKVYSNGNLLSHRVEFKVQPTDRLQFSIDYFYLFANQLNNLGGNPALSNLESRSIGHEVMLTTRWSISQNLFFVSVGSIAFPSDGIRRAVTEDTNPWFTFQISLFLGF